MGGYGRDNRTHNKPETLLASKIHNTVSDFLAFTVPDRNNSVFSEKTVQDEFGCNTAAGRILENV